MREVEHSTEPLAAEIAPPYEQSRLSAKLDELIRPGLPAQAFLYGALAVGAALSIRSKSKSPIVSVAQGLVMGAVANTVSSVVNHSQAAHKSVVLQPEATNTSIRFLQATLVGGNTDQASAMHDAHHDDTDGSSDPHSPKNMGRWGVFFGINGIMKRFAVENPGAIAEKQNDLRTNRRAFDNGAVIAAGIVGTHFLAGRKLGTSLPQRAASAALHVSSIFMMNSTFTADAHRDGVPNNVPIDPLTNIWLGGQGDHGTHHEKPYKPRYSRWDPGYVVILGLEKLGLAKIPAREQGLMG